MTSPLPAGNAQSVCLITSHRAISILLLSDAEDRDMTHETGYLRDGAGPNRPAEM